MDRYHEAAARPVLHSPIEWDDRDDTASGDAAISRFDIECQQYERHSLGLYDGLHCMDAPVPRSGRTGTK